MAQLYGRIAPAAIGRHGLIGRHFLPILEAMPPDSPTITSPCTGKCGMHAALPWCAGCGRTLEEIEAWPEAGEARRLAIMQTLPRRLRILAAA